MLKQTIGRDSFLQEELAHVMEDAKIMPSVLQVEVSVAVIRGCGV